MVLDGEEILVVVGEQAQTLRHTSVVATGRYLLARLDGPWRGVCQGGCEDLWSF